MPVAFMSYAHEDLTLGQALADALSRPGRESGRRADLRPEGGFPVYLEPGSYLCTVRPASEPGPADGQAWRTSDVLTTIDGVLGKQILPGGIEFARLQAA